MKTEERAEALRLRRQGFSVKEIECTLGVARSTVSVWVRDVELAPAQRARLVERSRVGPLISAERRSAAARAKRLEYQETGRGLLHARDASYAAGCALYWAEGEKCRNSVKIVNSDPQLLALFLSFLRTHFAVPNDWVGIACNLFADHLVRQQEIENYWLALLRLDRTSLKKTTINRYSKYSQKKRTNKLPFGTCSLRVCRTEIVQTIYGSIQELGGFDRPEWLD